MSAGGLSPDARARLLADAGAGLVGGETLIHGRYRVIRELGRGGMGVVLEAEDVALRRRVALKVLSGGLGPGVAELVLREARAAARLRHPGIAAVYDVYADADANGGHAIALELVEGEPLSALAPPQPTTAGRWIRDAARAVHHAHEQGIVHRDLKPGNLMLAGERIVVTDFGLAKELAADGQGASLSLSGNVIGTPSFMPPEQAGGRAREVDARSDVWGLGATLYDRLAGRPPFVARDVVGVLRAVVEDDPPPLPRSVPRDLALITRKCLAKEKERRYASAAELADDLERFLQGRPIVARAPSLRYRLARHARRHRALVGAVAVLVVVALGAAAWIASERRARAVADEAVELVHRVDLVLQDAALLQRGIGPSEAEARLDPAIDACRSFLARHPSSLVEAKLGSLLQRRRRHAEALAALDRAVALDPTNRVARLERGIVRARLHLERGSAGAEPAELDALRARALDDLAVVDAPGGDLPYLEVEHGKAERARLLGRLDEAERRYREVARLAPHVETPPALAALALARGDPDEAFRQAMAAVDLQRGFAPAYAARSAADGSPEAAVERAIRQHARASVPRGAGTDARLELDGLDGRFTDWAARLAERTSTAGAYAHRATGELRRAGKLALADDAEGALAALDDALTSLGHALTIDPGLADALGDRALAHHARAALLERRGDPDAARAARELARSDLERALGLAPPSAALEEIREVVERDPN